MASRTVSFGFTGLRDLWGLEPVSLTNKRGRLHWFGHVEHKDNGDRVKWCMKLRKLDSGILSDRIWRVLACPERTLRIRINGD